MNQLRQRLCGVLILCCLLNGYAVRGFGQATNPQNSAIVQQIMTTALSRCYSKVGGVTRIAFEPATDMEIAEIKALGESAVVPLATYLDLKPKDDLTQLFAVKFLIAIGGSSTFGPLRRAFAEDQWEVTRAAALRGMFAVSHAQAKPFVKAALGDKSLLVRQRAQYLWTSYRQQE